MALQFGDDMLRTRPVSFSGGSRQHPVGHTEPLGDIQSAAVSGFTDGEAVERL